MEPALELRKTRWVSQPEKCDEHGLFIADFSPVGQCKRAEIQASAQFVELLFRESITGLEVPIRHLEVYGYVRPSKTDTFTFFHLCQKKKDAQKLASSSSRSWRQVQCHSKETLECETSFWN